LNQSEKSSFGSLRRDFAAVMIAVESFAGHGFPPGLIVSSIEDRIVSLCRRFHDIALGCYRPR
jgi:hypothetical protein